MRYFAFFILIISFLSCQKEKQKELDENILTEYIALNESLELDELIACAAGHPNGFFSDIEYPTSVFFYPIEGAYDFRYFESSELDSPNDFSTYQFKALNHVPIFNGYLRRFQNTAFIDERLGIVTYRTPGKLHICNPIRQKTNVNPTELNPALVNITENGINPTFVWQDGQVEENAIYFQVISDQQGNLISGTYTYEKNFTFYDLENVVLNITDSTSTPLLESNQQYRFSMMGVSEDNWVNLLIEKDFWTN